MSTRRREAAEGAPLSPGRILITGLRLTPLFLAFREPYHWAGRVDHGSPVVLVDVETDAGITGVGESVASLAAEGTVAALRCVEPPSSASRSTTWPGWCTRHATSAASTTFPGTPPS